jgi:hypothetical protein
MPTYFFYNKNTDSVEEYFLQISKLDEFKSNNSHLEQRIMGSPGLSDPARLGLLKPASGFRDLLKTMKNHHRGSTINDF